MSNAYEEYMRSVIAPMRADLEQAGFEQLTTPDAVIEKMQGLEGTAVIVINSVCGCAAGQARPAVKEAIAGVDVKPDHLLTVFAGQDREATAKMRTYFSEVPPSSPSIAIWKDGALAYFIPRELIEDSQKDQIKDHLIGVLEQVAQQ